MNDNSVLGNNRTLSASFLSLCVSIILYPLLVVSRFTWNRWQLIPTIQTCLSLIFDWSLMNGLHLSFHIRLKLLLLPKLALMLKICPFVPAHGQVEDCGVSPQVLFKPASVFVEFRHITWERICIPTPQNQAPHPNISSVCFGCAHACLYSEPCSC